MNRFILFILLASTVSFGGMRKIFTASTVAASGTDTSSIINARSNEQYSGRRGFYSYTAVVTGSGTAKLEYIVPTTFDFGDDVAWNDRYGGFLEPAAATDIATGLTVGSYAASFTVIPADAFKVVLTETGGADSVTVDIYLIEK